MIKKSNNQEIFKMSGAQVKHLIWFGLPHLLTSDNTSFGKFTSSQPTLKQRDPMAESTNLWRLPSPGKKKQTFKIHFTIRKYGMFLSLLTQLAINTQNMCFPPMCV